MEPIALLGASVRTAGVPSGELAVLLREGRVLAVEVLANTGEGSVLLAIGRHSVPAETRLRLDPGMRFLVQVLGAGEELVLQILDPHGPSGESDLLRALRAVVGEKRPPGELLAEISRLLQAEQRTGELPAPLRALASALLELRVVPDGIRLRNLLHTGGLGHEAALAAAAGGTPSPEELARLRSDWKALFLRARAELAPGPLREALEQALAALEAEQLLNLAREAGGEPALVSFPFPDLEGWTTARLLVSDRRDRNGEGVPDDGELRLRLDLELSNLGPVCADFALGPRSLKIRVLVASEELAHAIQAEAESLAAGMSAGERVVSIQVRTGSREEAAPEEHPLDIRFLREHRLMNVAG